MAAACDTERTRLYYNIILYHMSYCIKHVNIHYIDIMLLYIILYYDIPRGGSGGRKALGSFATGSNPRLGRLGVSPFQASGGIRTLQPRASGLQSTTQGFPSGPTVLLQVNKTTGAPKESRPVGTYAFLLYPFLEHHFHV